MLRRRHGPPMAFKAILVLSVLTARSMGADQDLQAEAGRYHTVTRPRQPTSIANPQGQGQSFIDSFAPPGNQQQFGGGGQGGFPTQPSETSNMESIQVACSKEEMVVKIQFDKPFNGIVYSKNHYKDPECQYVRAGSGQTELTFSIRVDRCGSQFLDALQQGGQSYFENVIILQNEPGIQEVWDTARRIRCLWQGNLERIVQSVFAVDMLEQQIVTFSGDTANVDMEIQVGRGPFAPKVGNLVKIGEILTIVIKVDGDPGFDVHVKECRAYPRPDDDRNYVELTDKLGCPVKEKLIGFFQKTDRTGNTGANLIAYVYMQAFKFPDEMEVYLECKVELCKNQCRQCPTNPNFNQQSGGTQGGGFPGFGRRKRSAPTTTTATPSKVANKDNVTDDPVRVARTIRVVAPEDITFPDDGGAKIPAAAAAAVDAHSGDVCLSTPGFVVGLIAIVLILILSCILTAVMYVRVGREPGSGGSHLASSNSFHPFSSMSSVKA